MGFFDLIRELRTGAPNPVKAAKTMKFLGWGCILVALWNFILPATEPFQRTNLNSPGTYPFIAFLALVPAGLMFLVAARGIREWEPWGKRVGQAAIIVLLAEIILFSLSIMTWFLSFSADDAFFRVVFCIFFAIAIAQFLVPGYFGLRYLGRLPTNSDALSPAQYNQDQVTRTLSDRIGDGKTGLDAATRFKDSPVPFGIMGTFPLVIMVPLLCVFVAVKFAGPGAIGLVLPFVLLFIFAGPAIFNNLASPFQAGRRIVATFTGGGSIFLFNGTWPFFRLIVYQDALEVRVMFHRFLIPYDRMEEIPEKLGFFSSGVAIRSDLPEVPSCIRFSGFGMKGIVRTVNEARNRFLAASRPE